MTVAQQRISGDDSMGVVDLARDYVAGHLYESPLLLLSRQRLRDNAQRFVRAMPRVQPHYAVKANPAPEVLAELAAQGVNFEIASADELQRLLALGVQGPDILYSNPIKAPAHLRQAVAAGVEWYVVDSVAEVDKLAHIHPGASLYLRIKVSNEGSLWPLTNKFGVDGDEAEQVIQRCRMLGMDLAGVTFHVGSQCLSVNNWRLGIRAARLYLRKLTAAGMRPRLLNLGGGYPVCINDDMPSIGTIGAAINEELADLDPAIKVVAEPGRKLVASAACLVSQVIGSALRSGEPWLYLDCGYYTGLMEYAEDFPYPLLCDRQGVTQQWKLAGPTCDSIDVCRRKQELPVNMAVDDLVYLPFTGAYTASCASNFNGFAPPRLLML